MINLNEMSVENINQIKLLAKIYDTKSDDAQPIINMFLDMFGRDYLIEDHFELCWWLFHLEHAEHRDALDIITNIYNEKKHRAWGSLFAPTENLIELPQFIGDAYSAADVESFLMTASKLGHRFFDHPSLPKLRRSIILDFDDEQAQRINYFSAGHHLPLRYCGAGILVPHVRDYMPWTLMPKQNVHRAILDVNVAEINQDPLVDEGDSVSQAVHDMDCLCDMEFRDGRVDSRKSAVIDHRLAALAEKFFPHRDPYDVMVRISPITDGAVSKTYRSKSMKLTFSHKEDRVRISSRYYVAEGNDDPISYAKVMARVRLWAAEDGANNVVMSGVDTHAEFTVWPSVQTQEPFDYFDTLLESGATVCLRQIVPRLTLRRYPV